MERYDRQERIKGWKQQKLADAKVSVIGSGFLSDFLLVDLLSLGVGNIFRIGETRTFEFEKINPDVYLEQKPGALTSLQLSQLYLGDSEIVIDATNSERSKELSKKSAKNAYFSCSCDDSGFSISDEIRKGEQGVVNSMLCSGIVADEVRKKLVSLENDISLEDYSYDSCEPGNLERKIIQVGAGAIGTFSAIALASKKAKLTILDFDKIEESNYNRQFLFYDSVRKNKAQVLAERVAGNILWKDEKIGENFNASGNDFIFSCVDNDLARAYMNGASKKYSVPMINGGSSTFGGNAMPYFPGKTECLDCQTDFDLSAAKEQQGRGAECFHPSMIISNQITAAMMMLCLQNSLSGVYKKLNYSSGNGIYEKEIRQKCLEQCHGRR